jgi:Lysozyme inhibitor LprI
MQDCLATKARQSEQALRQAEKRVSTALSNWDEDAKYINLAKTKFAALEKAFATYREAQCAFASSLGGGAIGNTLDMVRLAGVAELNGQRAEQLSDAVSDLPLK